jgi:hypothetical protein
MSAAQIEYQIRRLDSAIRYAALAGRYADLNRFEKARHRLTLKLESMQ